MEWPSLFLRQPSCCAPPLANSPCLPQSPAPARANHHSGIGPARGESTVTGINLVPGMAKASSSRTSRSGSGRRNTTRRNSRRCRTDSPATSDTGAGTACHTALRQRRTSTAPLWHDSPQMVPNPPHSGGTICTGLPKGHRSRDGSAARPLVDTGVQPPISDGSAHAVAAVSFFDRLNHEKTVGCRLYGPLPVWRRPRRIP